MEDLKERLNEYLFFEFGYDLGEEGSTPTSDWPFQLDFVGKVVLESKTVMVFQFEDDKPYYAFAGIPLNFMPVGNMSLEDLRHQFLGSDWIASSRPVSLQESLPTESDVPSGIERRAELEALSRRAFPAAENVAILEGLYLRKTGGYVVLASADDGEHAAVAGTTIAPIDAPFPSVSAWRRLSVVIGRMIEAGSVS